jgi:F-type H+-transporting ATPase subunit c
MKLMNLLALVVIVLLVVATPAFAAFENGPTTSTFSGGGMAAGLGMGLTIIGAGLGLGKIGSAALESMARQPEVAGRAQTAMIIVAAMLEGATLASVILCFVVGIAAKY